MPAEIGTRQHKLYLQHNNNYYLLTTINKLINMANVCKFLKPLPAQHEIFIKKFHNITVHLWGQHRGNVLITAQD